MRRVVSKQIAGWVQRKTSNVGDQVLGTSSEGWRSWEACVMKFEKLQDSIGMESFGNTILPKRDKSLRGKLYTIADIVFFFTVMGINANTGARLFQLRLCS